LNPINSSIGSLHLSSHKFSDPHEALETRIIETVATSIKSCGELFDRIYLRARNGKGAVERFVDNCTAALRNELEELAGFCRSHDIENPIRLLVILNAAENFAVVYEGQFGAYERLLRESGGPLSQEHLYVSLAHPLLCDEKYLARGEGIKKEYSYIARHVKSITSTVSRICQGRSYSFYF